MWLNEKSEVGRKSPVIGDFCNHQDSCKNKGHSKKSTMTEAEFEMTSFEEWGRSHLPKNVDSLLKKQGYGFPHSLQKELRPSTQILDRDAFRFLTFRTGR